MEPTGICGPSDGSRRGWPRAWPWLLSLFLMAAAPVAADATMIQAGARPPSLDSRELFLFELALPLGNLAPDFCELGSRSFGAGAAALPASAGIGTANASGGPDLGTAPPGELRDLSKLAWELNALSPEVSWSRGTLAALVLIKSRLVNIESCIIYLQQLMRMINQATFGSARGNPESAFSNQDTYNQFFIVITAGGGIASGSSGSGFNSGSGSAAASSPKRPKGQLSGMHAAMLNVQHSRINTSSTERDKGANNKQRSAGRTSWSKITIKEFIREIFTQVYTYVLIFMLTIIAIFFRFRI